MNARIIKKLSKRIKEILPKEYKYSWVDKEIMEQAWEDKNTINNCLMLGGDLDCWGEGTDFLPIICDFRTTILWSCFWGIYEEGHKFEYMPKPDPKRRRLTGKFLIELAKMMNKGVE